MQEKVIFEEVQNFRQPMLWLFMLAYSFYITYITIKQVFFFIPVGFVEVPNLALIIFWLIFGVLIPILFYSAKMITKVYETGLYIFYYPFHRKYQNIDLGGLKEIKIKKYSPLADYGGWGIRFGKDGNAFNVSGDMGVGLVYEDKRNLLIGTQKPEELYSAIKQIAR
jgi:hypothetical protein